MQIHHLSSLIDVQMKSGFDVLKKIELCGSEEGTPSRRVSVCDSGQYIAEYEAAKVNSFT